LKKIKHKILVSAGVDKLQAILGALKGRLVDVLIIDKDTARQLLTK
jgi:DNA-binding transcriptional regulator LsrR (DeoR family)